MLDRFLAVAKVSRSRRYVFDVSIDGGSRKWLTGHSGIDGTIRDPISGIWRGRLDAKEHAKGT